jgi:hypothetical protein
MFREVPDTLSEGFFRKIAATLGSAEEQLHSVEVPSAAQRVVLLVVRFDHDMIMAPRFDEQLVASCALLAPVGIDVVIDREYSRFSVLTTLRVSDLQGRAAPPPLGKDSAGART